MNSKHGFILVLVIVALICTPSFADLVRLKSGKSVQGEIVEENDQTIKIKLDVAKGAGYFTVQKDEVLRIIRETPEERARRIEETNRAKGLVKDGDEWVTPEVKAARDAQKQAEQAAKDQQKAALQLQMEQLKAEQRQQQESEQAYGKSLERSRVQMTGDLRNVVFKLAFFIVLAIIAFALLKHYFWD